MKMRILHIIRKLALLAVFCAWQCLALAQNHTTHSVLSEHTWHRVAITQEGVYKLDYSTFVAMGVDMQHLNPDEIRVFGNVSGALPEANRSERYDDLNELAVFVEGADDGRFDEEDYVLFYGQEPTAWQLTNKEKYERRRNPYSDTTYYYVCVDSGETGLRISSQASGDVQTATSVVTEFYDYVWHESELFSPFSSGQNWFGEQLTTTDSVLDLTFQMPNLVKTKPLTMIGSVMGRSKNGKLHYDVWCNDNYLVADGTIGVAGEDYYGNVASFEKQLFSDSDTLHFRLGLRPLVTGHLLFLDYVEIYGWRELICNSEQFLFRVLPSQLSDNGSSLWVRNISREYQVWDVSRPLQPYLQEGVYSAGNFVFATDKLTEMRFVAFKPTAAKTVLSIAPVPNQNLHEIAQADMLILTSPVFWDQAVRLAIYHEENDNLHSVVVDVNEIYHEFSTGTPDPTALRDFIRMVYQRSGSLKYVTLFGKPSHDFRNIKGFGKNFVPTYESAKGSNHQLCFCTDDYFGLMDNNEGEGSGGRVDLGIGRLPVSTPQEADIVLDKIFHYADLSACHGSWKANHLFVADEETMSFIQAAETCHNMIDSINHAMNLGKVYIDAYQQYSTTSGKVVPEATADFLNRLEKGTLVAQYHGHGGVRGLTDENFFNNGHIAAMTNYDHLPFVFTATCEFAQYDDPDLVSAGELMFLQPNGGSVAMLTTSRPTYGDNNLRLAKVLMNTIYQIEGGRYLRFGDIIRISKSDMNNYSGTNPVNINIRFVFFGDPALRFPAPQETIAVTKVNGVEAAEEVQLFGMSMVNVEGEIRHVDGTRDTGFNGEVELRLFDKKSVFTTLGHDQSYPVNFSFYNDVIFSGKATVDKGVFHVNFQIPSNINPDFGMPRFSFYAYDSIRNVDASGVFENVSLGGTDPAMVADDEGPNIAFYWNNTDFHNGDVVAPSGMLCADLYDAQGIYHYEYVLGRDIMLNGNVSGYQNLCLNEVYEPALDDYRRGTIRLPVENLAPGTYTFTLRAWDTQNNSSEAELWLKVDEKKEVFLAQVSNYPNPFDDETWISFVHQGGEGDFDVTLEVYDGMGRRISSERQSVSPSDDGSYSLRWCANENGHGTLGSGLYFYRITLSDGKGKSVSINQKMILIR